MKILKLLVLATFPMFVISCGHQANTERSSSSSNTQNGSLGNDNKAVGDQDNDESFLKEAGSGGLLEVQLGRYAEQNASNQRVKKFGSMMVRDHTKANDELKSIADKKNITVSMNDKHTGVMNDMQQKKGADFDKDYMKDMVDDHENDVNKFQKEAENGKDPDVKAFASKTLPVLQMHLDSAKNIRDALK